MARKGNRDRGVTFKNSSWWVRLYVNGQEKWYKADSKSQARALYGRIKAEIREARYFPTKFSENRRVTLRAWIKRYLEGVTSPGLRNMPHYARFWSKLLGRRLLTEMSPPGPCCPTSP